METVAEATDAAEEDDVGRRVRGSPEVGDTAEAGLTGDGFDERGGGEFGGGPEGLDGAGFAGGDVAAERVQTGGLGEGGEGEEKK